MSDPINIKTAKLFQEFKKKELNDRFEGFDHSEIHAILAVNSNEILAHWFKFQQAWTHNAYKVFKDFDTYLILIYLAKKCFNNYQDRFTYFSMEEFYSKEEVMIEKINLIEISNDLIIPKETVRRKINYLKDTSAIYRRGKKIYVNMSKVQYQKPIESIKNISIFLAKVSNVLSKEDWFGEKKDPEEIQNFISKYFTICWLQFFRLQISYIIRHRKTFGDIETWRVWGSIGISQFLSLQKDIKTKITLSPNDHQDLFFQIIKHEPKRGINASSISDISGIPRATVIRKLKILFKRNYIKKSDNLEYTMNPKLIKDKKIEQDYIDTQKEISIFVTKIFELMKSSSLKK